MDLIEHSSRTPVSATTLKKTPADVDWGSVRSKRGGNWKGVPHAKLFATLRNHIGNATGAADEPKVWLSHNGGIAAGFIRSKTKWMGVCASNISLGRLLIYPAVVVDGCRVVIDGLIGPKYTQTLDLDDECMALVGGWLDLIRYGEEIVAELRVRPLTDSDVSRIVMKAARDGLIPWKFLGFLDRAFAGQKDCTALDLLRAFSSVTPKLLPEDQLGSLLKFRQLLSPKLPKTEVA